MTAENRSARRKNNAKGARLGMTTLSTKNFFVTLLYFDLFNQSLLLFNQKVFSDSRIKPGESNEG